MQPLVVLFINLVFFTSALADGLSLKFEWVVSSIQDSTQYSGRSLLHYGNRPEYWVEFWKKVKRMISVTLPPRPPRYINFFEPFHFTAGDQLVVPIGASHILYRYKKYNRGSVRKKPKTNEQTNNVLGSIQAQEWELCNSLFPVCISRLTLAWSLAKILQRY